MKRFKIFSGLLFFTVSMTAQESFIFSAADKSSISLTEKTIFYRLAEKIVPIKIQYYGDRKDLVFINLHDDEITSVIATKRILETEGGILIEIENDLKRNIRFRLQGKIYQVDPNRIFSVEGISKSLSELGRKSALAIREVEKLGNRIIELIPADASCVIALHNNTPGQFSVTEYAASNKRTKDSRKVYINQHQDEDDFFLTTDNNLYEQLAEKGFNTILQDNKNCTDDGSLSVYFGKRNIRYVNCETEHGKTDQYYEMIKVLISKLNLLVM